MSGKNGPVKEKKRKVMLAVMVVVVVFVDVQPMVKWLLPTGMKSLSLSTDLRQGPSLIAFIDSRPLSIVNQHYSVVRAALLLHFRDANHYDLGVIIIM